MQQCHLNPFMRYKIIVKYKHPLSPSWSTPVNTDFEPQNVFFRATDFYIFTAQSMLKMYPLLQHDITNMYKFKHVLP